MSHCDSVTVLRDLTPHSFHRNWEDRNVLRESQSYLEQQQQQQEKQQN